MLQGKRLLFDELVDDVSLDLAATLTSEELFDLFDLDAPPSAGATTGAPRAPEASAARDPAGY
ncbi:MAG TPA: hypothetical protein VK066_02240 [Chloroflexota bacterium]|nr:hypothetical protein [Chloroflexota bacterium]